APVVVPAGPATYTLEEAVALVKAAKSEKKPHIQVDNPSGVNLKFRIGSNELWFTMHDKSDDALLERLAAKLPMLQEIVEACDERYKAREQAAKAPKPPPATVPDGSSLQAVIDRAVKEALSMIGNGTPSGNGLTQPTERDRQAIQHE